jgi:hypothetical protein
MPGERFGRGIGDKSGLVPVPEDDLLDKSIPTVYRSERDTKPEDVRVAEAAIIRWAEGAGVSEEQLAETLDAIRPGTWGGHGTNKDRNRKS